MFQDKRIKAAIVLSLICFSFLSYGPLKATTSITDTFDFGAAINLRFYLNGKGASNYSISVSGGISRAFFDKPQLIPSYQLAINVYNNGIGTNMLRAFKATEIDVVNSFALTLGQAHKYKDFIWDLRTFNQMTANAIQTNLNWSLSIATNFLSNNHRRDQQVGFIGGNFQQMRFGYFNDGPPFQLLGLGDAQDRWWTGGAFLEIGTGGTPLYRDKYWSKLRLMLNYERFTGNAQDAFELSNALSLNYVPAKDIADVFLNRAHTHFGIRHANGLGINLSFLGQYSWDIQDLIHRTLGLPKHHSFAYNRTLVGFEYNTKVFNQVIKLDQ